MQLEFVPVEEFYFALTLAVRTLEEITNPALVEQVQSRLREQCGQASTVAAAKQNTFSYVFRVVDFYQPEQPEQLEQLTKPVAPLSAPVVVSISDWQDKLRLSSDYGWTLDAERKPVRTEQFQQRDQFSQRFKNYLQDWLNLSLDSLSA